MKRFIYLTLFCAMGFVACQNNSKDSSASEEPSEPIYSMVEEMPRFPGCEEKEGVDRQACANKKLLEYVRANLQYPEAAKNAGNSGQAVISFHVEKDGSISNAEIVRAPDPDMGMGAEAKRVVESFPKFIPGKQKGEPVIVRYNLPIKFRLD